MTKAVLTIRQRSEYDDRSGERYHFRLAYQLEIIRAAIGDDVVFFVPSREPVSYWGRGRVHAYIAAARIADVIPDPINSGYHYALLSDNIDFARPVPFKLGGTTLERSLRNDDGSTNLTAARDVVRRISDEEFSLIWREGNAAVFATDASSTAPFRGFAEPAEPFERRVVPQLINRKIRDPIFRQSVLDAYSSTCAVTGLQIINGGGAVEVEAAHIQPVEANGTDSARNGIALCRTAHWMFDRGLIGLRSNGTFDVNTRHVPEAARRMLRADGTLISPNSPSFRPIEKSIDWHWTNRFAPKLL